MPKFKIISLSLLASWFLISTTALADRTQERIYLQQILNQLNAIQPLILAAQGEQPKNTRIHFHYTQYRDTKGRLHNGLLEDVQAIQRGVSAELNHTRVEPRSFKPLQGDYVNTGAN